jgi:hypothetical protein
MLLTAIPAVDRFFASHSWVSLTVILGSLLLSIVFSVLIPERKDENVEDENVENLNEKNEEIEAPQE